MESGGRTGVSKEGAVAKQTQAGHAGRVCFATAPSSGTPALLAIRNGSRHHCPNSAILSSSVIKERLCIFQFSSRMMWMFIVP